MGSGDSFYLHPAFERYYVLAGGGDHWKGVHTKGLQVEITCPQTDHRQEGQFVLIFPKELERIKLDKDSLI